MVSIRVPPSAPRAKAPKNARASKRAASPFILIPSAFSRQVFARETRAVPGAVPGCCASHFVIAKWARMATVYRGRANGKGQVEFEQGFTPDDPPDYPVVRASGGMISTAMDYGRFLQMCLNGGRYGNARVLSAESIRKATTPKMRINERSQYGFGWMIGENGVYSHTGSDGTMAWVDPANDLIGMVLTQSPGGRNPTQAFQKLITESCTGK